MRKKILKYLPRHEVIRNNRWLAPFSNTLLHPRLWHLNRHSVAGAVAAGLFCGLIPGPFQMLGAAICAVMFRVNLPLALICTVYSNPITIVPLYFIAFAIGQQVLATNGRHFVAPPELGDGELFVWLRSLIDWTIGLGAPLALGLALLAASLALIGYFAVRMLWRAHLIRAWNLRKLRPRR